MEPRALPVDRTALLAALTARDEGLVGTYIDLRDGELLRLYDPAIVGRTNEPVERRLDEDPDRYAKVPLYTREYRLMIEFVDSVEDDDLARLLDAALSGREAFRRFDAVLLGWPAERSRWEAFRVDALAAWAVRWLGTHGRVPAWEDLAAARPEAPLATLLRVVWGEGRPVRTFDARDESEAHAVFVRCCRDLAELAAEPFRARGLSGARRFELGGVEVRREGTRVLVVAVDTSGP